MKVWLTGGSGMVGRNVQERVARQDGAAAGLILVAPRHAELNLLDASAIDAFLERERPDAVIHAAGTVGGIQANIASPVRFLQENILMGTNVVMGARRAGITRLINLSSSCVYPRNGQNPLREDMILTGELEPTNEGYAIAKIATARLCDYISREDPSFLYKTLIPCNLYGRHDKFDPVHSHMIPAVIAKIAKAKDEGVQEVEIWGDGQSRREFMYAGDVADFIVEALARIEALPAYLNVGLGYDYTINEYYQAVAHVLGYDGAFRHDLTKPTGMRQKLVSTETLKAFGWSAPTSLEEGLRKTLDFYRNGQSHD